MYILDTNTCIFVLKNRTNQIRQKFKAVKQLCISSVTYGELCYGIENGDPNLREERYRQLDIFTQRLLVAPWNEDAARHYGHIRAALKKAGKLVTNNTKEFCRIPDITLEDWI